MRRFHPDDVRTYLEPKSAPYELDRIFSDADTHSRILRCEAVNDVVTAGLSDHAPVVLEVAD